VGEDLEDEDHRPNARRGMDRVHAQVRTYEYRVLPRTEVTTAAGVFDAFPVERGNARGILFLPA
jgi:hypothetical protein